VVGYNCISGISSNLLSYRLDVVLLLLVQKGVTVGNIAFFISF
jgi:hypothetical protein